MSLPSPDLTVLIPAYNEAGVIGATLTDLGAEFRECRFSYELLVVNNNSSDKTAEVVRSLADSDPRIRLISTPPEPGYGVAIRTGLKEFLGNAVVITMADASDSPADVRALAEAVVLGGYDCAFGTRFASGTTVTDYPALKLLMNRAANRLIARAVGYPYNDFTNGFKCFSREVIEAIQPLSASQFDLTIEMSIRAVRTGARIKVLENDWQQRDDGESKFNLIQQSFRYLSTLGRVLRSRPQRLRSSASARGESS